MGSIRRIPKRRTRDPVELESSNWLGEQLESSNWLGEQLEQHNRSREETDWLEESWSEAVEAERNLV